MKHSHLHQTAIAGLAMLATCAGTTARAADPVAVAPVFARVFSDHAVLQRDRPITIWGTADAAQQLTVSLADRNAQVRADKTGHWRATLPAMPAGGPYKLTVSGAAGTASLADIKVGDV